MSETKYGIKLKSLRRYHYRGKLYEKGKEYAVVRELRDHLTATGHFIDCLIEEVEPTPIAASGGDAPIDTSEDAAPGKPGGRGGPPKVKAKTPSADAVTV